MERLFLHEQVARAFKVTPIVTLLGPRQSGKTTLARDFAKTFPRFDFKKNYFDLEDPQHLELLNNPSLTLANLTGLIVIDEIQRKPDLFPFLRTLADRKNPRVKFLILGSASRDLIQQSSESLAGRISYIEVSPFGLSEVGVAKYERLWLRGGYPRAFLAKDNDVCWSWRENYITTFLERDIPNLGIRIAPQLLRRFWMMIAHCHGNIFNASDIGNSLALNDKTMKHYLDILTGTFMVRTLMPWYENIAKRQVKRPKIYLRDSGLLHQLLGIADQTQLSHHPKLGASWEGFALESIILNYQVAPENAYFWSVHGQAELDLLLLQKGKRIGFEIKYSDTPKLTRQHHDIIKTLKLDRFYLVTPEGTERELDKTIRITTLKQICQERAALLQ